MARTKQQIMESLERLLDSAGLADGSFSELTDDELVEVLEQARREVKQGVKERDLFLLAPKQVRGPGFQDVDDDELVRRYRESQATMAEREPPLQEAEPEPPLERPAAIESPVEPHPITLESNPPPTERTPSVSPREERERRGHEEMGELIQRTHERLDREAERDHRLVQSSENDPMTSEPTWHVHQRGTET